MKDRHLIVSSGVSSFVTACLESYGCFRCGASFKPDTSTAFHAQVHRMKITSTLTGGVLCETCAKSFRKWVKSKPTK